MQELYNNISIKSWALEDRPREKWLINGRSSMSDAELIAILIGSGNRRMSAVDLARYMLLQHDNSLASLAKLDIEDLMEYKGIGQAKAISIAAALELSRRINYESAHGVAINSAKMAYNLIAPKLMDLSYEEFWVAYLSRSKKLQKLAKISSGSTSGTLVDPRRVFKDAIRLCSDAIILFHNHPSGSLSPSRSDIKLTEKLAMAATYFDIKVVDHLIIGSGGFYSFNEEGLL